MRRLKVVDMGETVQGVRIRGDRNNPEPETFRVVLPFGEVDIVRCTDDTYWVHLRTNNPHDTHTEPGANACGQVIDARADAHHGHGPTPEALGKLLNDPKLYHVALKVGPMPGSIQGSKE